MDKRERITLASIEAFQELGIEKTKISDIVKRAGIAQGTFYLYFPSKLSVMPAIAEVLVRKTMDIVRERVAGEMSFAGRLEQVVESLFIVTQTYREVLAMIYAGMAPTEHMRQWETVYAPFYTWMHQLLQEGQNEGIVRASLQTERTAKLVIGLIETSAEQIYLYDVPLEEEAARQKAEVIDFVHHALGMKG